MLVLWVVLVVVLRVVRYTLVVKFQLFNVEPLPLQCQWQCQWPLPLAVALAAEKTKYNLHKAAETVNSKSRKLNSTTFITESSGS